VAEFAALSAKVSARQASEEERERWRELRARLAPRPPPPPDPAAPKRSHLRKRRKLRVRYAATAALNISFTDDVGAGGLCMTVKEYVTPGTELVLRLELGDAGGEAIAAGARVAWCRREGGHFLIGLEFVGLRAEEVERVEAYLHRDGDG
jgi:hypothetical protein